MALNFPDSPTNGQSFTGPNGVVWSWDGTKWVAVGGGASGGSGGATITVSDSPPASPMPGQLWFDSAGAQMYLREDDGTSIQWIPVVNQAGALTLAAATNVGRNLIHNPLFNIAQRGAGPFTAVGYTLDRWVTAKAGSDTVSIARVALSDTDRTNLGDESATLCMGNTFTGSAVAGSYNYSQQNIEDARRLAGKTVTISFYANADRALKLGVNILQIFGTGGSPSAATWVLTTGLSVSIPGTTFARYSVTIAVPSIVGKTIGTNGDSSTALAFWYSSASGTNALSGNIGVQSGLINLWGVQLEIGSQATPLEKPDPQQDLAKCQRFYEVGNFADLHYNTAGGTNIGWINFNVFKRSTPIITFSSLTYSNSSGLTANQAGGAFNGFGAQYAVTAAGGASVTGTYIASADL